MRDSNSFLIQCHLADQDSSRAAKHSNLSRGRRAWRVRESSSTPSTVKQVEGPSSLFGWRGICQSLKSWRHVSRLFWQTGELRGPSV